MMEQFENYLISKGYKKTTPSGKPSTVYDYIGRIQFIANIEAITVEHLAKNIDNIIKMYGSGGIKEDLGNISHRSVINALKRFS